jgi:cytochrome o ubiquinol oxidase subunit II
MPMRGQSQPGARPVFRHIATLRARAIARWSRFAAIALAASTLSGCGLGVLDPHGPIGGAERTILYNALAIMLAIVIPTILVTLAFAWWFRASNTRARYRPDFTYSGRIELVVWSIPTLVIMFLGGIIWIGSHELDPMRVPSSEQKPLEIQVVSLDWKWLFILPEQGIASINELVVPAQTPLHFSLTAASVMNAFFVPKLGSMIYTMNGMTTQLYLKADQPGDYEGLSSHFSGDGFPGMRFALRAVDRGAFDAWVAKARGSGPALDNASYTELEKQSSDLPASTYRSVADGLFDAIAMQKLPPGPGPDNAQSKTPVDVSPRPKG